MAGFSMAAHRRYRKGCEKNRGEADIVSRQISRCLQVGYDVRLPNWRSQTSLQISGGVAGLLRGLVNFRSFNVSR
jgi:hypothetical protein